MANAQVWVWTGVLLKAMGLVQDFAHPDQPMSPYTLVGSVILGIGLLIMVATKK